MEKKVFVAFAAAVLGLIACNTNDPEYNTDTTDNSTSVIDSTKSVSSLDISGQINIVFNGSTAIVSGSYSNVSISNNNGAVIITSTTADWIQYNISGNGNGSLKIYSTNKGIILSLNNLTLTNTSGVAINSQCKKKNYIVISGTSTLTDGNNYSTTDTDGDDAKACFFSEGQMIISGNGSLNIIGNNKHALCSDDYIYQQGGSLYLTSNAADGMKANDGIIITGGTTDITSADDGITCDTAYVSISGGTQTITSLGKGINAYGTVTLSGGKQTIHASDNALTIDSGAFVISDNAATSITSTSGKGIKVDLGSVNIKGGTLTISSYDKGIDLNQGNIYILEGTTTITTTSSSSSTSGGWGGNQSSGAEGISAGSTSNKMAGSIYIEGGKLEITASDDAVNAATTLEISGGYTYACSTGNDAIDSNGKLNISGGYIVAIGANGAEEPFDCDNSSNFIVTGGTFFGVGGSTTSFGSSSTQAGIYFSGSTGKTYTIADGSSQLMSFTLPSSLNGTNVVCSASGISSGNTYTLYTGSTISGYDTNWHGLYVGGTATTSSATNSSLTANSNTNSGRTGGNGENPGGHGGR